MACTSSVTLGSYTFEWIGDADSGIFKYRVTGILDTCTNAFPVLSHFTIGICDNQFFQDGDSLTGSVQYFQDINGELVPLGLPQSFSGIVRDGNPPPQNQLPFHGIQIGPPSVLKSAACTPSTPNPLSNIAEYTIDLNQVDHPGIIFTECCVNLGWFGGNQFFICQDTNGPTQCITGICCAAK